MFKGSKRDWLIGAALLALPASAWAQAKAPENLLPAQEAPAVPTEKVTGIEDSVTAPANPAPATQQMAATVQPIGR